MNPSTHPFDASMHDPAVCGLQEISAGLDAGGTHRPMAASGLLPAVQVRALMQSARHPATRSATTAASDAPFVLHFSSLAVRLAVARLQQALPCAVLPHLLPMAHLRSSLGVSQEILQQKRLHRGWTCCCFRFLVIHIQVYCWAI